MYHCLFFTGWAQGGGSESEGEDGAEAAEDSVRATDELEPFLVRRGNLDPHPFARRGWCVVLLWRAQHPLCAARLWMCPAAGWVRGAAPCVQCGYVPPAAGWV